jgi:3-oxoacyl-[acyl-carrier-protein] synthase III
VRTYLAGVGAFLPERIGTEQAVARGWYPAARAAGSGIVSVCVAAESTAPEMAVLAAREALDMAGPHAADVRAVLHTHLNAQGPAYWDAAPYIALHTLGTSVPGYDLRQSCNGGLAAVELGARLTAGGDVLVTVADRFDTTGFDRWTCDSQAVYGDGAAAVLVSARGGFARILAIATGADNGLEAESRGESDEPDGPVDFTARRERYHETVVPLREHLGRVREVLTGTLKRVLDEAGRTVDEITRVVPVVSTQPGLLGLFQNVLGIDDARSTWDFGATTGHLGAADNLAGLHHLVTTGAVRAGDTVLLIGDGTGFTTTMAVVELTGDVS